AAPARAGPRRAPGARRPSRARRWAAAGAGSGRARPPIPPRTPGGVAGRALRRRRARPQSAPRTARPRRERARRGGGRSCRELLEEGGELLSRPLPRELARPLEPAPTQLVGEPGLLEH